jgi:pyrimidine operon attenuation protein/uracil phosphoribosyltransferase
MNKRLIISAPVLDITLKRLCHQLIENHGEFTETVLIGLQPRGPFFAGRLHEQLQEITRLKIPLGTLDITFHRDDFRSHAAPLTAAATDIPFALEGKRVVLIDDVLWTGRSVRAALDAMTTFGRPKAVELLVLIDRKHTRQLPVEASYTGREVNTLASEKVLVEWQHNGAEANQVWLLDTLN